MNAQMTYKDLISEIITFYIPNIYSEIEYRPNESSCDFDNVKRETNLIIGIDGCILSIQYIKNKIPNIIIINLCEKTICRVGNLLTSPETKFFDLHGFRLDNDFEKSSGQRIDDWWLDE